MPFPGAIVQQLTEDDVLRIVNQRISALEASDGSSAWIPVDPAVDGNPYSPGYTPASGWADAGPSPLAFKRFLNWTMLRGGFAGGVDGSVVFTLPELFWPDEPQPMILPLNDGTGFGSVLIGTDGTVTYQGTCACGGGGGTGTVEDVSSPDGSIAIGSPSGPTVTVAVDATWLAAHAVVSLDGTGGPLVGNVTLSAGAGIALNQVGQNIEIDNTETAGITEIVTDGGLIITDPTGPTVTIDPDLDFFLDQGFIRYNTTAPTYPAAWLELATAAMDGSGYQVKINSDAAGADDALIGFLLTAVDGTPSLKIDSATTGVGQARAIQGNVHTATGAAKALDFEVTTSADDATGFNLTVDSSAGPGLADGILVFTGALDAPSRNLSLQATARDGGATLIQGTAQTSGTGGPLGADLTVTALADGEAAGISAVVEAMGAGGATGIDVSATADVDGDAVALVTYGRAAGAGQAFGARLRGANTDGNGWGTRIEGYNQGTGTMIGLQVQVQNDGGSGTLTQVLVLDSSSNPIFRIDDDGTVHIKTGSTILADL